MKIPEKIRISGIDYRIDDVRGLNDGEHVLFGRVSHAESKIELNAENQGHQFKCVTLWHEILHAISEQANLELGADEEKIVDAFAFGIYQVLQDNGASLFDIEKAKNNGTP